MISALGHCEDPACSQSSSTHELVRLFRCSIHCDRLLCLFHLNAHNVYYEEERKQNDVILNELQNCLTLYQRIFEQHIQSYRALVHQASTLLLHNTSSIVPIENIRPVLEKLQGDIAIFQQDKVIIKSETELDITEFDIEKIDSNLSKDCSLMKKETNIPKDNCAESDRSVVVRLERVQFHKELPLNSVLDNGQIDKNENEKESTKDENSRKLKESIYDFTVESNSTDENVSNILKLRKSTDENQQPNNKRSRILSPVSSENKQKAGVKKKNEKTPSLKRLQT
ncbi:unnamed protein product [Rotaria sordida]|uniref:Uncharacterized protein n=1 Tax=Rotaria sordida TaxID=392033 RepID=A0A813SXG1_9BILA|nr:unnamed protein product [Rotaria sordida]CAF0774541.1 unnamed protein product [Rotaria sordida]CAF0801288.1 unnamed protein product [Rotaria sordida]CAF0811100.1 unnamed protein product [Rotaria sordida]CAF3595097.1 unnamed protein product [Rotaria sordida]